MKFHAQKVKKKDIILPLSEKQQIFSEVRFTAKEIKEL